MKSLLTSHQTFGAITSANTAAITYGPGVRQARRANGSSSRIRPSVAASANAAYFDQNAPARNSAGEHPVDGPPAHDRAPEEQSGQRPERQLHLVVREFHHRDIVVVDRFERRDRDQRLELAGHVARQQPDRIEADHRRQRPEHIDRVDLSGEAIGEVGDPPRQRRVLPVAELPFLAEREAFDQIELQVGGDQRRHQRPHHQMEAEHPGQHHGRPAPGIVDDPVEKSANGVGCGHAATFPCRPSRPGTSQDFCGLRPACRRANGRRARFAVAGDDVSVALLR